MRYRVWDTSEPEIHVKGLLRFQLVPIISRFPSGKGGGGGG